MCTNWYGNSDIKANENEKDEDDYLVDHSIVLYLISPEGEFLEFFTQKTQVTDIVSKILSHTSKTKAWLNEDREMKYIVRLKSSK